MAEFEHHHMEVAHSHYNDGVSLEQVQKIKALLCAVNLISRNLPLPEQLLEDIAYIYHADALPFDGPEQQLEDNGAHLESQNNYIFDIEANGTLHAASQSMVIHLFQTWKPPEITVCQEFKSMTMEHANLLMAQLEFVNALCTLHARVQKQLTKVVEILKCRR